MKLFRLVPRAWCLVPVVAALTFGAAPTVRAQNGSLIIAVLPFENGGSYGRDKEDFEALRLGIAAMVASELMRNPASRAIERDRLQSILNEQGLAAVDKIDVATAVRIGKLLGARYVVVGTFIDLYGDFRVDARIVDVQAGHSPVGFAARTRPLPA